MAGVAKVDLLGVTSTLHYGVMITNGHVHVWEDGTDRGWILLFYTNAELWYR